MYPKADFLVEVIDKLRKNGVPNEISRYVEAIAERDESIAKGIPSDKAQLVFTDAAGGLIEIGEFERALGLLNRVLEQAGVVAPEDTRERNKLLLKWQRQLRGYQRHREVADSGD